MGALIAGQSAQAHEVPGLSSHNLAAAWSTQWWLWVLVVAGGAIAARGYVTLWRHATPGAGLRRWQAASFGAGWLALVAAVLSPLDALGEELFWAHMVQHELLMLLAAPLLVLGRPLAALVWGLPARWRPLAGAGVARSGLKAAVGWLTRPLVAWSVHALALWAWHVPWLFDAALRLQWVHDLQHVSFFATALLFWWALLQGRRGHEGGAVLYLFTTAVHTAALGALLTFAQQPWYEGYLASAPRWGLHALEDQQIGGLIMWVPCGVVYLVAALALLAARLNAAQAADRPERAAAG